MSREPTKNEDPNTKKKNQNSFNESKTTRAIPTIKTTTEETKINAVNGERILTDANIIKNQPPPQSQQSLWQPLDSQMTAGNTLLYGRFVKTYEEWLEEKKQSKSRDDKVQGA